MRHPFALHLLRTDVLPEVVVDRLDAATVDADLAAGRIPAIPPGTLRSVVDAWVDYRDLIAAAPELAGKARLVDCARILRDAAPERSGDEDLPLLEGTVRRAIDGGTVRGRAVRPGHPGLAAYAAHVDHVLGLTDVSAHRWLALERAEAEGVLCPEYRWPADLEPEAWIEPLLPRCVAAVLHRRARSEAAWVGAEVLIDLLTSPPRRERVVSAARSGAKVGVVVRQPDGAIIWRRHGATEDLEALLREALAEDDARTLVVPAGGIDPSSLDLPRDVETRFVRAVGLAQAAKAFRGPHVEILAEALAERAQDPRRAWTRLDPESLGLVEYQQSLEPGYVKLVLGLAVLRAEQRDDRVEAPRTTPRLPLVQSLDDLRPGMVVTGTVTQIAPFGAFVNLGVGRDGLVHVSELCDERVASPTEVVHVGQAVTARVLEVDRERGRISLSLRSSDARPRRRDSSRQKAIAALDKLFK